MREPKMPKECKWAILGNQSLFEKGGSLVSVIPKKVVKHLNLYSGAKIIFLLDTETGDIILGTADQFKIQVRNQLAKFGAGLSEKEIVDIFREVKEEERHSENNRFPN